VSKRLKAILLAAPLALDCLANVVIGGSPKNTLSGEAWVHREHGWWGWTHQAIDNVFDTIFRQKHHCEQAAIKEAFYGSRWKAWLADLKG
jgi:hypothetical protein